MSDLLMDSAEAAERLGVSEDWIKKEARKGTIPSRKIGQRRRFTEQDLLDYIERSRQGTDPWARSAGSSARVGRSRRSA